MPSNTEMGKAFEYACANALQQNIDNVEIEESEPLATARASFEGLDQQHQTNMQQAALSSVRAIKRLEPMLNSGVDFIIKLQPDSAGMAGDVRDVVIEHDDWNIGFSCKHNHHAVKHSRLSATINFGKEWMDLDCSQNYFDRVVPIFYELRDLRDNSRAEGSPALWSNIENKEETYYKPILNAFMDELKDLDAANQGIVPTRLLQYLIGRHDFYKVIAEDSGHFTRIEAVNIYGTLNTPQNGERPLTRIPQLVLPDRIYHMDYKRNARGTSGNTIEVICNNGWEISMRIHNASSRIEPSLKFDVNLISLPGTIYSQTEPWEE